MRAADVVELAQPLDAVKPGGNTLAHQLGLNLLRPIDAAPALVRGFDGSLQARIFKSVWGMTLPRRHV